MQKILFLTNMTSLQKHWENSLMNTYHRIHLNTEDKLYTYLKQNTAEIILMLDELSIKDIQTTLNELKKFPYASVLVFNANPQVHHASTLIKQNIKGYEHSYLNQENLLTMLNSINNGKNWLFTDLTNYIINKFIQDSSTKEPKFMDTLTIKEKEIALMIADGLSNKEIASLEKNALSTVKGHIKNIFYKAGVSDRISLALKFK